MTNLKNYKTECCKQTPVYQPFSTGFGHTGRTIICPKCRSCCVIKTGHNLINTKKMITLSQSGLTRFIKNRMPKPDYSNIKEYLNSKEYKDFIIKIENKYGLKVNEEFEIRNQNYNYSASYYITRLIDEISRVRMIHF